MSTATTPRIRVTPEGRDGFWLVADRDSLKAWLTAQAAAWDRTHEPADDDEDGYTIHNMIVGPLMLGADHGLLGVLDDIDNARRIALATGRAWEENLRHALALVLYRPGLGEYLSVYDIGDVADHLDVLPVGAST